MSLSCLSVKTNNRIQILLKLRVEKESFATMNHIFNFTLTNYILLTNKNARYKIKRLTWLT